MKNVHIIMVVRCGRPFINCSVDSIILNYPDLITGPPFVTLYAVPPRITKIKENFKPDDLDACHRK